MKITIQKFPRCFWHTDCKGGRPESGIIKITNLPEHTLAECLNCGDKGIIPIGAPFDVCFTAGNMHHEN